MKCPGAGNGGIDPGEWPGAVSFRMNWHGFSNDGFKTAFLCDYNVVISLSKLVEIKIISPLITVVN
jgi:hypothetical protein